MLSHWYNDDNVLTKSRSMNDTSNCKLDSQRGLKVPELNASIGNNSCSGSANFKVPWKIVLLGDAGVGKSSLVQKFVNNSFSNHYSPTVEDCYSHNINLPDGLSQCIEILDTSGFYRFPAMRELNIKIGTGFILTFDLTNEETLNSLTDLRETIVNIKKTENIPIILLGNKCDLIDIDTDPLSKHAQSLANDHFKCTYVETSAKNDINVSKAFQTVVELILKKIDEQNALNAAAANISRRSSTVSFMRRISISLPAKTDVSRRYSDTVVNEIKNQNSQQNNKNTNDNNHKKDAHKKHCIIS